MCGEAGKGKAQCVGAKRRDALGEFFAGGFRDRVRLFGIHQVASALRY